MLQTAVCFFVYFIMTIPALERAVKQCVVDGEVHAGVILTSLVPGINLFFFVINNGYYARHYRPHLDVNQRYKARILDDVEMMARRRELSAEWVANLVNRMEKKEPKTFVFDKPNILTSAQTAAQPAVPSPSETVTVGGDVNIPAFLLRAGAKDDSEVTRAFAKQLYGEPMDVLGLGRTGTGES